MIWERRTRQTQFGGAPQMNLSSAESSEDAQIINANGDYIAALPLPDPTRSAFEAECWFL